MTKPRKQQISLDATPYYHCVSRCVRRAFLCGTDKLSGRSYEHRRQQIQNDALRLASIFFIDVAAFAVLPNHYHLVLHVDRDACMNATPMSIAKRWHCLFSGNEVTQRFIDGEFIEPHEQQQLNTWIDQWRIRLHDISWFMKVLNENIARQANKEDECTGHFWESRFKSQALLDEKAVLSCMAYVDLNPIRAGMSATPEQSDHTSIQLRIRYWKQISDELMNKTDPEENAQPNSLMPFAGELRHPMPKGIIYNLLDYLELVDWTGRQIREDKRGSIDITAQPILERIGIEPKHWIELCTHFEERFKGLVGSQHSLNNLISSFGLTRKTNHSNSRLLYS